MHNIWKTTVQMNVPYVTFQYRDLIIFRVVYLLEIDKS